MRNFLCCSFLLVNSSNTAAVVNSFDVEEH